MVVKLIEDIKKCLDSSIYLSALITALTLPDICGKAAFPDDRPSDRYVKWYDEYIGKYEQDELSKEIGIPYTSGIIVYNLRNSLIHEGNPNINEKTCNIQEFDLLIEDKNKCSIFAGSAGVCTDYIGNEVVNVTKSLCVNVRQLCLKLCDVAEYYYANNKEKFNFFNSKLTYGKNKKRRIYLLKNK